MAVNPDFRDLFSAFNAASVRYLLVGGYAVGFHAEPRFTKDPGVWIEASPSNAQRAIDGVELDTAWTGRVETHYGDQTIQVIGRAELVANRRASGRPQDLLDVELLLRHSKR